MTTNRMGLEQESRLSDEQVKAFANEGVGATVWDAQAMARELLAYREASKEPVAWMYRFIQIDNESRRFIKIYYDAEEKDKWDEIHKRENQFRVEVDEFYAAPPIQAVTVPDDWIKCSERLPGNDDMVLIWPKPDFGVELDVGQFGKFKKKDPGWYAQIYEHNYGIEWHPITVTHWQPLPAAPKAP